jgi:hypothetical protein
MHGTDWSAGLQQPPDYTPPAAQHSTHTGLCVCVSWWGRCGATMAPPCCYPPVGGRSLEDVETPPIDGGKLAGHWARRVTSRTSFWLAIGPEIRPHPFSRFSRNFRSGEMTNRRCRGKKKEERRCWRRRHCYITPRPNFGIINFIPAIFLDIITLNSFFLFLSPLRGRE